MFTTETPIIIENAGEFVIAPVHWSIIVGLILPVVVGFITRTAAASESAQHVIGIVVAAIAAIVQRATLVDGSAVFTTALLLDVALIYVPQILSYWNFWKPVVHINERTFPTKGIG